MATELDLRALLTQEENSALDLCKQNIKFSSVHRNGTPRDWLMEAFIWRESPQGYEYWELIHDRLKALERGR